jgi:hypothetical protein
MKTKRRSSSLARCNHELVGIWAKHSCISFWEYQAFSPCSTLKPLAVATQQLEPVKQAYKHPCYCIRDTVMLENQIYLDMSYRKISCDAMNIVLWLKRTTAIPCAALCSVCLQVVVGGREKYMINSKSVPQRCVWSIQFILYHELLMILAVFMLPMFCLIE